ncbi:MAG: methionine gamma-lyase family protein [Clostridia bacterium]
MKRDIIEFAEKKLEKRFSILENIALINQEKVLNAFREYEISSRHFSGTTGYGYDDIGRDALGKVFARVFGAESGIVSPHISCGTHALSASLFGILRPGDVLFCVTGMPYDTLVDVIEGENIGSLKDFGIQTKILNLKNNQIDMQNATEIAKELKPKLIYFQRSRGYEWRSAISVKNINSAIEKLREISPNSFFMVDNCYGEFVEEYEPLADLVVGSLIKNAGGGIAPTGAYIVGSNEAVELVAKRLTSPSLGSEVGSYEGGYRSFYQGLFLAPHIVLQALKGSYLIGEVLNTFGYEVMPNSNQDAYDIIKSIKFEKEEELIAFVQTIQKYSPVDSYVSAEPWDMPGYTDKVIMASGAFVSGSSIEMSADAPIKKPFVGYYQGGLTYEHAKIVAKIIAEKFGYKNKE